MRFAAAADGGVRIGSLAMTVRVAFRTEIQEL